MTDKQLEALAEEVLRKHHLTKDNYSDRGGSYFTVENILAAMKEMYHSGAKEEAVGFAEWVEEKFYYEHLLESWIYKDDPDIQPKNYGELYDLFKSNKTT